MRYFNYYFTSFPFLFPSYHRLLLYQLSQEQKNQELKSVEAIVESAVSLFLCLVTIPPARENARSQSTEVAINRISKDI